MTDAEFRESLLQILERKDHPAWRRWTGPGVRKDQLLAHFQQEWLVFVRDFPRFLGRVHGACPVAEVRRALAANIYEEETGGLSFHRPHPELFLDMMQALGFERADFERAKLIPEAAAYRAYLDAAIDRSWIVGAAVVTLWIEGSVHERKALAGELNEDFESKAREHFLVRYQGLKPDQLMLMKAHHAVEGGHRDDAWMIIMGHAKAPELRAEIVETMQTACDLWHLYRDAVSRRAGI